MSPEVNNLKSKLQQALLSITYDSNPREHIWTYACGAFVDGPNLLSTYLWTSQRISV